MKKEQGDGDPAADYVARAMERARRRGPAVHLFLNFFVMLPIAFLFASLQTSWFFRVFKGTACMHGVMECLPRRGVAPTLFVLGPYVSSIVPAMMTTNFIAKHIPPLRRYFEARGSGYRASQNELLKPALVLGAVGIAMALLGLALL